MKKSEQLTPKIKLNLSLYLIKKAVEYKAARRFLLELLRKKIYRGVVEKGSKKYLKAAQIKKYEWAMALFTQVFKNYDRGYLSPRVAKKILGCLGQNFFRDSLLKKSLDSFQEKYETRPPSFIVVSPTQRCNLNCQGCYAVSSPQKAAAIPFDIFDRILKENHDIFGSRFVTISGGEPLLYRSQGKDLLDIFARYPDTYFIFFTNGTLINEEVAKRLAEIGNASPQISVEGWGKETDERRGRGIFRRILKATQNLKKVGVPFVISVTATKKNLNTLLSDKFYEFWFEKEGAIYMWMFQLMPIGRGKEVFGLMPSPEERIKLFRKWEQSLKRGYPIADFWNSGLLSDGCIAYGRFGGYFHINWNGNMTPCVFIPYHIDNIYDLYKQGKTIADGLFSDFFKKGREWQKKYGLSCPREAENWLMPCSIRDNYKNFRENILTENAKGEDQFAEDAKDSKKYYEGLVEYDKKLKKLTQSIWEKEFREYKD